MNKEHMTMGRHLFTIASILFMSVACYAQAPMSPSHTSIDDCMLNTTDQAWNDLGITSDQLDQVKSIQTLCETEHKALMEARDTDTSMEQALLERHRESTRAALTTEQYAHWLRWCAGRPTDG
jgi:hypothetical protein